MSTIKDVAKYTGLSIATISKYLNGGNVLEENRTRIAEAIQVLDYKVNRAARSLKTNRSMTVGVLLPTIDSPFFSRIVSRMDTLLQQADYHTVICSYNFDRELELKKLRFLLDAGIDGLVLVPEALYEEDFHQFRELMDRTLPLVLVDRTVAGLPCDKVLANNTNVSYDAVEHLILHDHRRIGIITGPLTISTAEERLTGYRRALEAYSLPEDPAIIKTGAYDSESGYRLFKELMAMDNPPGALFLTNYDMMLGALTALYERQDRQAPVPEMVGYDNLDVSRILRPPISMVVQSMDELGEETARLLLRRMAGDWDNYPTVRRLRSQLLIP